MMPQHQMKDHNTIKLVTVIAERDNAIHERNLALSEKKAAVAERDVAILQRDAAIAERDNAIMERDNAIASLEYARENGINGNSGPVYPPGSSTVPTRGSKHIHHHHLLSGVVHPPPPQVPAAPHSQTRPRDVRTSEAYPLSVYSESAVKPRRTTRPRKSPDGASKCPRKRKTGGEDSNKHAKARGERKGQAMGGGEDLNIQLKHEWKIPDLGLNQVSFDETTMPSPVCSCTGTPRQCYRWGNGGWQSACCTMSLSMYPLPAMPSRRHARVGGRKMSGGAFTKLLCRLASGGHDLSLPVDLKDHWAKHGTNRYITIR